MDVIQLGINGFGRIGRIILRACLHKCDIEISAINDPALDVEYICYLIKFDSTHGKLKASISHTKDEVLVNDKHIRVFREKLPSQVPWQTAGVQYVIEASGMFTTMEKASGHLVSETVRRVIVTAPSVDIPMIILGVNDSKLHNDKKVISSASSTLYCLAPIIKILEDNYGVADGFVTSIHAMTPSLKPIDGLCLRGKHWRDHRSIHQNIIPATTGACKALGKVIPRVKDKLSGLAFRVPIVNVSVLDLSIRLNTHTTLQDIIEKARGASKDELKNILNISNENAVSSDFIGDSHSCVLDVDSSLQLKLNFFKLICWYENEYSYACRVIDTIYVLQRQFLTEKIARIIALKASEKQINSERELSRKLALNNISQDTGLNHKISPIVNLAKDTALQLPPLTNLGFVNKFLGRKQGISEISSVRQKCVKTDISKNNDKICQQSKENIDYIRAHEKLNDLKEQLSKIVIITEKLLTKSYSASKTLTKPDKEDAHKAERSVRLAHNKNREVSSKIVKHFKYEDDLLTTNHYLGTNNDENLMNIDHRSKPPFQSQFVEKETVTETPEVDNKIPMLQKSSKNALDLEPIDNYSKSDDSKGIVLIKKHNKTMLVKKLHNLMVRQDLIKEKNVLSDKGVNENMRDKNKNDLNDETVTNCHKGNLGHINQSSNSKNTFTNKNCVLADKLDKSESPVVPDIKIKSQTQLKCDYDAQKLGLRRISERLSVLSENTTNVVSPNTSITISNVEVYRHKEDIYDKLDSISGTDSNNSFQTGEKRSQVIDISELTSSLEDLARLDKICKIIEISDELSNKLFSTLDDQTMDIKKKKWSFKDLCERIKLDEFCDNLFRTP